MHRLKHGICRRFVIHCRYADAEIQNLRAPITFTTSKNEKPFGKKDLWMQSNEGGWRKLSVSNKAHCSTVKSTRNTRKQKCCYRASFRRKENTEDGTTIVGRFPVFRLPLFDNWPKNKYTLHTTLSVFFLLLVPGIYIFKQLSTFNILTSLIYFILWFNGMLLRPRPLN